MTLKRTKNKVRNFFYEFLSKSSIHGFSYIGNTFLHIIERALWLALIVAALYFCVDISLESWMRYLHHSTVVSIERDHYYWNTSLPALTICPMTRLSEEKFEAFTMRKGITGDEKEDFFKFMESLANSTYLNFDKIRNSSKSDAVLNRLKINPSDYQRLIYDLTEDLTRKEGYVEHKIRNVNNREFIKTTQVLTEYGICYSTNNYLAINLSTSMLLENKVPLVDSFYRKVKLHEVRYGNLFDGEVTYSFIGFKDAITIFLHSPYETMNIARSMGYTRDAYEFEALSIEIITSKEIKDTFISQRGCRFHWESDLKHYKVYSKNLCMSECRIELAYKRCGCIPHFYPNKVGKTVCHYQKLMTCFPRYQELFLEFQEGNKNAAKCECLQNCLDSNVIIEKFQVLKGTTSLLGSIGGLVIMKKYPLIRFQREVIFTLTDFFVSIGGTAGFFIGLSVLGVIEIIYFFSLRVFWFIFGNRN